MADISKIKLPNNETYNVADAKLNETFSSASSGSLPQKNGSSGIDWISVSTKGIDTTPTVDSSNLVTSGGVKTALNAKQDTLVSGTNIKTINNNSILGSGNLDIGGLPEVSEAGTAMVFDGEDWTPQTGYGYRNPPTPMITNRTLTFTTGEKGTYAEGQTDEMKTLVEGDTYTIVWNDTEYTLTVRSDTIWPVESSHWTVTYLGNGHILYDYGIDTGEPFLLCSDPAGEESYCFVEDTSTTQSQISVIKISDIINKLDIHYLPDGYGYITDNIISTKIIDSRTLNFTYDEDWEYFMVSKQTPELSSKVSSVDSLTVTWDGTDYEVEKQLLEDGFINIFGNAAILDVGEDTGEPFCYALAPGYFDDTWFIQSDVAVSKVVSITTNSNAVSRFDTKYLFPTPTENGTALVWHDGNWVTTSGYGYQTFYANFTFNPSEEFMVFGRTPELLNITEGQELDVYVNNTKYHVIVEQVEDYGCLGFVIVDIDISLVLYYLVGLEDTMQDIWIANFSSNLDIQIPKGYQKFDSALIPGGGGDVPSGVEDGDALIWVDDEWIIQKGYGYIEDNTEYLIEDKVLTWTQSDDVFVTQNQTPELEDIVVGTTYTIKFNNTVYTCKATRYGGIVTYIGNLSMFGEGHDTGEPFLYCLDLPDNSDVWVSTIETSNPISVYIPNETVHKINSKLTGIPTATTNGDALVWVDNQWTIQKGYGYRTGGTHYLAKDVVVSWLKNPANAYYHALSYTPDMENIQEGEQYTVKFNNTLYSCMVKETDSILYLGNLHIGYSQGEDTGEPFLYQTDIGEVKDIWYSITNTSNPISVYYGDEVTYKFDSSLIPNSSTPTFEITNAEMSALLDSGLHTTNQSIINAFAQNDKVILYSVYNDEGVVVKKELLSFTLINEVEVDMGDGNLPVRNWIAYSKLYSRYPNIFQSMANSNEAEIKMLTTIELSSFKVSSWDDIGTYAYPTAQLVKDSLDTKEDTSNKVSSWQSTTDNTHYPSEKLVKDSLNLKQDTLVSGTNIKTINNQNVLGSGNISTGTITGITMNGSSKGTSGVVDLGTVITAHQDISGKVDKITGKGLSTNDYDDTEKQKVTDTYAIKHTHSNKSFLDGLSQSTLDGKADTSTVNAIGTRVTTIEGKIPNDATSSNQLADKSFVNSSINSVTAYYITKNAAGDQFATKAELLAATTFYSGGEVRIPTRNDYCIVQADESKRDATTGEDPTTRYIYQNNQWEFQYIVNSTTLTSVQLSAINSGINSTLVSNYNSHLADTNIHVTSSEKSTWNAKGTYSKPSGGIPKTDLSSAVQTSLGKADTALQTHQDISGKENTSNKVTSISSSSTDTQYPSAKCVYDNLNDKVDKVIGKGLSSNDYTDADKTKVGNAITEHQSLANYYNKSEVDDAISGHHDSTKQDTISDLTTIRSNASSGASKVSCTDTVVGGFGYTKNTGTVTSVAVKMNGSTKGTITSSGTIDLGTVSTSDTKNTAGSTNTSSKIYLVGATSQAANPQTYSHDTAYVGTDGCLYSNSSKVFTSSDTYTKTELNTNCYLSSSEISDLNSRLGIS